MKRTYIAAAVAAGLLAVTASLPSARAQDWPSKPVHILIGFGAGGGTDVATRILADGLAEALGQQFVVENKPGAGGTIAGGIAAKAPKDGYNLLAISMGHSVSAVMVKQVPYDAVKDFEPVGIFTNSAFVVVVPKSSPATNIKSLIEYVNKQPGKLNYSTVGLGSTQHLIAEHLRQRASINAQAVSYRTTGEVVSAVLRGDAAYAVELYHPIRGQVDSGDLRIIAVATPKRWPAIPNVPTLAESGVQGIGYLGWYGLVFPAGTPKPVVARLHKEIAAALKSPEMQKRVAADGAEAVGNSPAEFSAQIKSELEKWAKVAEQANLKRK